jgi:hypothetical protein
MKKGAKMKHPLSSSILQKDIIMFIPYHGFVIVSFFMRVMK